MGHPQESSSPQNLRSGQLFAPRKRTLTRNPIWASRQATNVQCLARAAQQWAFLSYPPTSPTPQRSGLWPQSTDERSLWVKPLTATCTFCCGFQPHQSSGLSLCTARLPVTQGKASGAGSAPVCFVVSSALPGLPGRMSSFTHNMTSGSGLCSKYLHDP